MQTRSTLPIILGTAVVGLVILLLAVAFTRTDLSRSFGRKTSGLGYTMSVYNSEDDQSFDETKAAFDQWIIAKGFRPMATPGGRAGQSSLHSAGDVVEWYSLPMGSSQIKLCIATNRQNARSIQVDMDDTGKYTAAELAATRAYELQIWLDMISWFETNSKHNMMNERPDMNLFPKYRTDVIKAYTDRHRNAVD